MGKSYIFYGASERYLKTNSLRFARELLQSSKKNPPDLIIADASNLSLEDLREYRKQLYNKPFEGIALVLLIFNADKLTQAQSSLILKVVEEPPDKSHIIFTAPNIEMVLDTIVSRSYRERVCRSISDRVALALKEGTELSELEISVAANFDISTSDPAVVDIAAKIKSMSSFFNFCKTAPIEDSVKAVVDIDFSIFSYFSHVSSDTTALSIALELERFKVASCKEENIKLWFVYEVYTRYADIRDSKNT